MNITGREWRETMNKWSSRVGELLEQRPDLSAAAAVQVAADQFQQAKFQLAVLGKAKRGKSTLINALLGRRDDVLAPIDKLPASSAITKFSWADKDQATVQYRDGRREAILFPRIREFVTEEFNPENRKGVDVVEVVGPFDGLDRDIVLVDTPGAGSIHEHHDALLHAFIPQADAVVFLLTARMPIDQDELELLGQVKEADIRKVFFAINRIDELSAQDLQEARDHNQRVLRQSGVRVEWIHEISAKWAFQGDWSGSGVEELAAEISAFLSMNKGQVLSERLISRVAVHAGTVLQGLDVELSSYHKSTDELEKDLLNLRNKKHSLESDRSLAERKFTHDWTLAVDQLDQAISSVKHEVRSDVSNKITQTPVLEVSALARRLPTFLNQAIDERLSRPVHSFEEAARSACNELQVAYPTISVGESGTIAIRTKEGQSFVAGSASGLAAATTGAGLAAAGSATAAGIAVANAAAMAATTTVTAPSLVSGLLSLLPQVSWLAPLATGTATVAAPAALTVTPLWVALAGPVGWTLAGVGLLAVPFSWRLSKLKLKEKLDEASQEQIRLVFNHLKTERVPALRNMGRSIVEEFQIRLDRELQQIEAAMVTARDNRPSEAEFARLSTLAERIRSLMRFRPADEAASQEELASAL